MCHGGKFPDLGIFVDENKNREISIWLLICRKLALEKNAHSHLCLKFSILNLKAYDFKVSSTFPDKIACTFVSII